MIVSRDALLYTYAHMINAFDVVKPFLDDLHSETQSSVQIVGGLGMHALTLETTEIDHNAQEICIREPLTLPVLRDNGTRRDVDALVMTTDETALAHAEERLKEVVDGQLKVGAFGIHSAENFDRLVRNPLGIRAVRTALADRYMAADGTFTKATFPFSVPITEESLATWHVTNNQDFYMPVSDPFTSYLDYAERSIGGRRPKDAEKLQKVAANLVSSDGHISALEDEKYAGQRELLDIVYSLRNASPADELPVVRRKKPYTRQELLEHSACVLDPHSQIARRALRLAQAKARVVRWGDTYLVDPWQRYIEPRVDALIKNR